MNNLNNSINTEHSRISNRNSEMQKYRDDLASNLTWLRQKWAVGEFLAENKLIKSKNFEYYILSEYWYTRKWAEKLMEMDLYSLLGSEVEKFEWLNESMIEEIDKWYEKFRDWEYRMVWHSPKN